jgi:hypothetical protein
MGNLDDPRARIRLTDKGTAHDDRAGAIVGDPGEQRSAAGTRLDRIGTADRNVVEPVDDRRAGSPGILLDCFPLPCLAILSVIRARRLTSFPELRSLAASLPKLRFLAVSRACSWRKRESRGQPAGFLQRGSRLRGEPVAHNPNYAARRSGNDVGAIRVSWFQAWPQWRPPIVTHNLEKPRVRVKVTKLG